MDRRTLCLIFVVYNFGQGTEGITLTIEKQETCGSDITLICTYTGNLDPGAHRLWKKGSTAIVTEGTSTNTQKYTEDSSGSQNVKLTISSFEATDSDYYFCEIAFDIATLAVNCTVFSCTSSGWSQWINAHNSSYNLLPGEVPHAELGPHERGGDYENRDSLPSSFCALGQGTLTSIECLSVVGQKNYTSAQPHSGGAITCDVVDGLRCQNRLTTAKFCLDYKVRFYCTCKTPAHSTRPGHVNGGRGQVHATSAPGHGVTNSPGGASGGGSNSGDGGRNSGTGPGTNPGSNPGGINNTIHNTAGPHPTRTPVSGTTPPKSSGSGNTDASKGNPDNGASVLIGVSSYTMTFLLALIYTLRLRD